MRTFKQHLFSFSVVVVFCLMAIASTGIKRMSFTKENGQIPPDFKDFEDTLLVISHPENWGYNKYLKKNFSGNYSGKYKIINKKELKEYPVDRYPYIFDHDVSYTTKTEVGGTSSGRTSTYASSGTFYLVDRRSNKTYQTKSSAFYSKLMRAYIQALDKERKK